MKVYYRLAAGAALGAIALTATAPADAKPKKHATARKRTVDPRDAKIRELEAKVDALTQRLDAQESAQQATAQQVQSAQAAAAAAQTQASTALNQAQTAEAKATHIETQVTPPLEKALKTGWFANTTIGAKAFLNVSNIDQKSTDLLGNTTDNLQNGTQAELKRFYISVDHKFNDIFSADLTTDFRYNTNGTSKDVLVYVKKAYLQAKLSQAFAVRVGEADLAWVPFVEGLYGYRFVENTLIDRTKFGTSTDWGVHVLGSFGPHNLVSYQVSAINGAGYKTLSRSTNTIDLEGRIAVNPIKEVTLAVGAYSGKLGKSNDTVHVNHRATRFNAVAAYTDKRIRAGVEYFAAKNWLNIPTAPEPAPPPPAFFTPNDKAHGWSAFGSFAFTPQIAVFGRYDWIKPTSDRDTSIIYNPVEARKDNYFNIGVNYKPIPPIDLALVYKREKAKNGFISTSNGTIGGLDDGTYDEFGIFGQFVF